MADQFCVLGRSITIRGDISGDEDLVVQGHVAGKIVLANHLTIDESADVEADVNVGHLTVNGSLRGEIRSREGVSLQASARVVGDIQAPKVTIDEGAVFTGRIAMDFDLPDGLAA